MQIDPSWTGGIDALVSEANEWLEALLPADRFGRSKAGVNARLVRHYTTEQYLSPPDRVGREARYTHRHLLELLVLRRLMADGVSGPALLKALEGRSEEQLTELAQQGSLALEQRSKDDPKDAVEAMRQSALGYISNLQKESAAGQIVQAVPDGRKSRKMSAPTATTFPWQTQRSWQAIPGLSITLEQDAQLPETDSEWASLMRSIEAALRAAQQ